jgi:hypothetical protein
MNKEKYARLTVVVDLRTDKALRYLSAQTDIGISEIVRELIAEPAAAMADALSGVMSHPDGISQKAAMDQIDMFVEHAYQDYRFTREQGNG